MFRALLKTQLLSVITSLTGGSGKKRRSRGAVLGLAALYLFMFANFFIVFGNLFTSIGYSVGGTGYEWLFYTVMGLMSCLLMFIGSVFSAQAQLYSGKDNDLLLSLPIPRGYILLSRMLTLWLYTAVWGMTVIVPAGVCAFKLMAPDARTAVFFILSAAVLPFLVTAVSCVFGWLLSLVTGKARNKSVITTVFALVFMVVYVGFYSSLNGVITRIATETEQTAETLEKYTRLMTAMGKGIAGDSIPSFAVFLAFSVAVSAVIFTVISKTYFRLITRTATGKRHKFSEKMIRSGSAGRALLGRECLRFVRSPGYMLNCGTGMILTVVFAVLMIIKPELVFSMQSVLGFGVPPEVIAVAVIVLLNSVSPMTAPSVSIEGKTLWIVRSMPVSSRRLLGVKLLFGVILQGGISALAGLVCAVRFKILFSAAGVFTVVLPVIFSVFFSALGLILGLKFPRLDWLSENEIFKHGPAITLSMFAGLAVCMAAFIPYVAGVRNVMSSGAYFACVSAALAAVSAAMCAVIFRFGTKRFEEVG
ncbi:MAG: hypothetical protein IIZ66_09310 [Clostridia bacterium]|nr:hypothetical protein [Clostridia bacterium]